MRTLSVDLQRERALPLLRENARELAYKCVGALWPPNFAVVVRNAAVRSQPEPWRTRSIEEKTHIKQHVSLALDWLKHSQDKVGSGGIGSYQLYGWTRGYPEVTGYTIPTFWDAGQVFADVDLGRRARWMSDWELSVQKPGGGWEGGVVGDGEPPIVFNTGQVVRGLVRTYEETRDETYLEAAKRAGDWIVRNQDEDGSWATANYRQMKRVYDSYVAAPLVRLARITGNDRYSDAARQNCEFVLANQRQNGWFENCDNSPYFNDAPITHTLCYTTDGLLETGQLLDEERFVDAALKAADGLRSAVHPGGYFPGRLNAEWQPSVKWSCLTGCAQLGIVLMKIYELRGDREQLATARSLFSFVAYVQRLGSIGRARRGAIAGSFPIWGTYAPLRFPCWATKYFVDLGLALLKAP